MSAADKYERLAEGFTAREYGDPERYFHARAELVLGLGPPAGAGDRLLDLACADGSLAGPILAAGLAYTGLDASPAMLAAARRRFGERADFVQGDLLAYRPPEPVEITCCFRSLHFVEDRAAFLERLAGYTTKKVVFDFSRLHGSLGDLRATCRGLGLELETRPFLVPQHRALPRPLANALRALEPTAAGRRLAALHFASICAVYRA